MLYNMDEPWQYHAKWNKQDTKGQILHDFTWSRKVNSETESRTEAVKGEEEGNG